MGASGLVWALTVIMVVALMVVDYVLHVRKAHVPTLREAVIRSATFVALAILFGIGVIFVGGPKLGVEYFACYLTDEALSVDNLFVFLVIVGGFAVPRTAQQKVLLFGIAFALVTRTGFIFIGAALIEYFHWAFYLFGLLLLVMAANLAKPTALESQDSQPVKKSVVVRLTERYLRISQNYYGDRLFTVENGRRMMTPMLLVMIAVGGIDLLFAFDSIPALFGLTHNVYLVFTATAFSLMGLRQLYFLIDGLLDRLGYLSYGLAVILGFIGVKLLLEALHNNKVPFINGGKPVPVVTVSTAQSLIVIILVLLITAAVSLWSARGQARNAIMRARRYATEYLDLHYETDRAEREKIFTALLTAEHKINALPPKYRTPGAHDDLMTLLRQAHAAHEAHT